MYAKPGAIDPHDGGPRVWAKLIGRGLLRPLKMLAFQPIVQVFSLYQAIVYGIMYLTLTSAFPAFPFEIQSVVRGLMSWRLPAFSQLWVEKYHYSVEISGLHYIALGLGFTVRLL